MHFRPWVIALAVAGLFAACDSTSPGPSLDGVWGGRVNVFVDTHDSLTLALGEQDGQIRGFAILRSTDGVGQFMEVYDIAGSITDESVELTLSGRFAGSLVLRGTLLTGMWSGRLLTGTLAVGGGGDAKPIALRPFTPGDGVAGTWALTSTSGPPLAIRDTIVALPDGRARRSREQESFSYSTIAMWSRRGDWVLLEQFNPFLSFGIPFLDSLRIESNALVRSTRLFDGSTITETYARAP